MSDCDLARQALGMRTPCCNDCHAKGDLSTAVLRGAQVRVCCTLAACCPPADEPPCRIVSDYPTPRA